MLTREAALLYLAPMIYFSSRRASPITRSHILNGIHSFLILSLRTHMTLFPVADLQVVSKSIWLSCPIKRTGSGGGVGDCVSISSSSWKTLDGFVVGFLSSFPQC